MYRVDNLYLRIIGILFILAFSIALNIADLEGSEAKQVPVKITQVKIIKINVIYVTTIH